MLKISFLDEKSLRLFVFRFNFVTGGVDLPQEWGGDVNPRSTWLEEKSQPFSVGHPHSFRTRTMSLRSVSVEHFNLTAESAEYNLDKALQAIAGTIADAEEKKKFEAEMKGLRMIFKRYMESKNEKIDWNKIKPPSDDLILPHSTLPECSPKRVKELSSKLAVLKLNGGLGTTMGCVGPKSVIEVREGQSFLDLTVKQIKVRFSFLSPRLRKTTSNFQTCHQILQAIVSSYFDTKMFSSCVVPDLFWFPP